MGGSSIIGRLKWYGKAREYDSCELDKSLSQVYIGIIMFA
jgi:hypothetical protein